jgi:hypothetical protein
MLRMLRSKYMTKHYFPGKYGADRGSISKQIILGKRYYSILEEIIHVTKFDFKLLRTHLFIQT